MDRDFWIFYTLKTIMIVSQSKWGVLMANLSETKIFNQRNAVVESWYWALKSSDLVKGKIKNLKFLGEDLAIYRGEDGIVRAVAD
jgi:hypothetical protein